MLTPIDPILTFVSDCDLPSIRTTGIHISHTYSCPEQTRKCNQGYRKWKPCKGHFRLPVIVKELSRETEMDMRKIMRN